MTGTLPAGPVSDLNVIFDPRRCTADLSFAATDVVERRAACTELMILNLAAAPIECTIDAAAVVLGLRDAVWISSPAAMVSSRGVARAAFIEIGRRTPPL